MIRIKSDFSDSLGLRRAVSMIAKRGILSMFDNVLFHLTIKDEMIVNDDSLVARMKYMKLDPDSMAGRVAKLAFRAIMIKRMDLEFLNTISPENSWFDDPIFFSRASSHIQEIRKYLRNYIADYHGIRQAIREFPDNVFHFFRDELASKGDIFHNLRKPLYVWSFRGIDQYMYEYLDQLCDCPDIKYELSLLSEARSEQDFHEFSKQMIVNIARYMDGE